MGLPDITIDQIVTLIRRLQDDGLMDVTVAEVLQFPGMRDDLVNEMKVVLMATGIDGLLCKFFTEKIRSIWNVECMHKKGHPGFENQREFLTFSIRNKTCLPMVYVFIAIAMNELVTRGKLNNILVGVMKILLTTGRLDIIILTSLRWLLQSEHLKQRLVDAACTALLFRQLDEVFLSTAVTLKDSGELHTVIMSAFTEILHSGNLDDKIKSVIENQKDTVSCCIASFVRHPLNCHDELSCNLIFNDWHTHPHGVF